MKKKSYKEMLVRDLCGVDFATGLQAVQEYLAQRIATGEELQVTWEIKGHIHDTSYPRFKRIWKHNAVKENEDAFNKAVKITPEEVITEMINNFRTIYEARRYTEEEMSYCCDANLEINSMNGDYVSIPIWCLPTPTWLYYKYIACGDESYKEEFEEVFNGKH